MTASANVVAMVQRFEGLKCDAYPDSVGVWTIGYGHTSGVVQGLKIDESTACLMLRKDLSAAEAVVTRLVKVPLTQNQFDALVDFVFNLGQGNFAGSTLLKKLNAGDYQGAAAEFIKWDHAGGKELEGLKKRRREEALLFLWSADGKMESVSG